MFDKHIDETPPDPDRLLTAAEVTGILHISRSLLYNLIQRGELPALHFGRALRFRWQDIQEYLRMHSSVLRIRPKLHIRRPISLPRRRRR